jgi:hypothetical protein
MWKSWNSCHFLQQNNSAIAEQVKSRDLIIDELNDRVAVFERTRSPGQPSTTAKEMNDEAPRTQKLVDDSQCTEGSGAIAPRDRITQATHQDEIDLQHAISTKSSTIQQKEPNLTVIGTYVDKLVPRGLYAVARDIEVRERKMLRARDSGDRRRARTGCNENKSGKL